MKCTPGCACGRHSADAATREDPRWDAAQACALAVAEDGGLYAACLVAPRRYASREEALDEAEAALRDVRGARARRGRRR